MNGTRIQSSAQSVLSVVQNFVVPRLVDLDADRTQIGRTSDGLRTQNAASFFRPKLCFLIDLRFNIKNFGRFGRKIPEHLVVASGQWVVGSG